MAKKTKSLSFKNATINKSDMTIVEYTKDDSFVYRIKDIIDEWDSVDGLSITIKSENTVEALDDSEDGDGE